ncbi:MAG: alpha/beta fold hydrolase [Okeania sp. SIO3I5]|uniref:alpha/beta fold hydrolase n=1 Tax=Okeania sp. SIO3I5 TaxID=2607805 RepID=UPI0013B7C6C4|nr:alpha/beta fold hydrolase [Okeania sp. SIO3I5]NEQ39077.1 alpha/beta fold hydrolase [Okeania sp. SIO3I5]
MSIEKKNITVGSLEWFYREAKPDKETDKLPILLLHGLPSQSHSWTVIMPELAQAGYRAIAPDWIGCGLSPKLDKRDFPYTPEAFIKALGELINSLEIERFYLVVQGFLGSVGLQYALRNPEKIERLTILNTPLSTAAKLPWQMQQLGIPFVGDMLTQDPLFVDRTLEKGSRLIVADEDLEIYRSPYLKSSAAGRAILAIVQKLDLKKSMTEIESGFKEWQQPTLIIWGIKDPWLDVSQAENLANICENGKLVKLPEAAHYPQEHWSGNIIDELLLFLRQKEI